MTSISPSSSIRHHHHQKAKTDANASASSSSTSSTLDLARSGAGSTSGSGDAGSSTPSIDKLLSQVIDLLQKLQNSAGIQPSGDGESDPEDGGNVASILTKMDQDKDGMISSAEFAAARPSHVSEDQATALFKSYDTAGKGSLSIADLTSAINNDLDSHRPPPPPPQAQGHSQSKMDLFSSLDTNGDGVISKDEFAAGGAQAQATDNDINTLLRLLGGKIDGQSA